MFVTVMQAISRGTILTPCSEDFLLLVLLELLQGIFLLSFITYLTVRAVSAAEANFVHMKSADDIIPCMTKIKNTTAFQLTAEEIKACDEDVVKPVGQGFIKKYHHFSYEKSGEVKCQYIRGEGSYVKHKMRKLDGIKIFFLLFFLLDFLLDFLLIFLLIFFSYISLLHRLTHKEFPPKRICAEFAVMMRMAKTSDVIGSPAMGVTSGFMAIVWVWRSMKMLQKIPFILSVISA